MTDIGRPGLTDRLGKGIGGPWRAIGDWIDRRLGNEEFRDGEIAHGFKSDAAAIEEAPIPLPINVTLYVLSAFLTIAIVWSVVGVVDRIVVAPGKVTTRTPLLVMQPFTTSRILQIHVKA